MGGNIRLKSKSPQTIHFVSYEDSILEHMMLSPLPRVHKFDGGVVGLGEHNQK
jgi:hypothetical protein